MLGLERFTSTNALAMHSPSLGLQVGELLRGAPAHVQSGATEGTNSVRTRSVVSHGVLSVFEMAGSGHAIRCRPSHAMMPAVCWDGHADTG